MPHVGERPISFLRLGALEIYFWFDIQNLYSIIASVGSTIMSYIMNRFEISCRSDSAPGHLFPLYPEVACYPLSVRMAIPKNRCHLVECDSDS